MNDAGVHIRRVNNGVYKTGFATTQSAYNEHIKKLFEGLNEVEDHLAGKTNDGQARDYLCGEGKGVFTEADLR